MIRLRQRSRAGVCGACGAALEPGARFCRACGAAVESLVPGTEVAAVDQRRLGPRLRRQLVVAGVVVLVVAAGLLVLSRVQNTAGSPEVPVRAWFAALQARDTAAARELRGGANVLAGDALADGYVPPHGLEILGVAYGAPDEVNKRPNKNVAYVSVRYQVGDQVVDGLIEVWRDRDGLVREWSLGDGALGPVDVLSPLVDSARLAGAKVRTWPDGERNSGTVDAVWAPPGIYTVTAAEGDPLWVAEPAQVTVLAGQLSPSRTTAVALELSARPEAVAEIGKQIRARVDECARRDELALYDCPFSYSGLEAIGATEVAWRVDSYPEITLKPAENPYRSNGSAEVITVKSGRATATFSNRGTPDSRTVDIAAWGSVKVMKDGRLCWNEDASTTGCRQ